MTKVTFVKAAPYREIKSGLLTSQHSGVAQSCMARGSAARFDLQGLADQAVSLEMRAAATAPRDLARMLHCMARLNPLEGIAVTDLNEWDPEPSETIFPQTHEESPELPDDSAPIDLDFLDRLLRLASLV